MGREEFKGPAAPLAPAPAPAPAPDDSAFMVAGGMWDVLSLRCGRTQIQGDFWKPAGRIRERRDAGPENSSTKGRKVGTENRLGGWYSRAPSERGRVDVAARNSTMRSGGEGAARRRSLRPYLETGAERAEPANEALVGRGRRAVVGMPVAVSVHLSELGSVREAEGVEGQGN